MKIKTQNFPVSMIVPMLNSSTTIIQTLDGIKKQKYPVAEIIIVDNVSTDDSISLVKNYILKNKKIKIKLIKHKKNKGVGASYNEGVMLSASSHVVFMHSDSTLPTENELKKLTDPFRKTPGTVATYSYVINPEKVWLTYNFWMKCLMARAVGNENAGMNDKFDCIEKETFIRIGGFDDINFGHHIGIGAEDGDLHIRLKKVGRVEKSDARVLHLHYLKSDYKFKDYVKNRKLLARSYGRLIRVRWKEIGPSIVLFFIKPTILLISILPFLFPYNLMLLLIFSIWYMKKMYTSRSTILNPMIILLPFVTIYLMIYEAYWTFESFAINRRKI